MANYELSEDLRSQRGNRTPTCDQSWDWYADAAKRLADQLEEAQKTSREGWARAGKAEARLEALGKQADLFSPHHNPQERRAHITVTVENACATLDLFGIADALIAKGEKP